MRVMIDTNVLLSALLFPGRRMNALIDKITTEHQLVLSYYVVDERSPGTRTLRGGKCPCGGLRPKDRENAGCGLCPYSAFSWNAVFFLQPDTFFIL